MTDATDATDDRELPQAARGDESQFVPPLPEPPYSEGERVARGLALALLVIPAGVVAWTVLWSIGFVASVVSWGVAVGAIWLYRRGSRARVTRTAFWSIIAILVVTIALSFLAGMFTDLVAAVGVTLPAAVLDPRFWGIFGDNIFGNGDMWAAYLPQVGLALLFAALGCFMTLRRLSRESRG